MWWDLGEGCAVLEVHEALTSGLGLQVIVTGAGALAWWVLDDGRPVGLVRSVLSACYRSRDGCSRHQARNLARDIAESTLDLPCDKRRDCHSRRRGDGRLAPLACFWL